MKSVLQLVFGLLPCKRLNRSPKQFSQMFDSICARSVGEATVPQTHQTNAYLDQSDNSRRHIPPRWPALALIAPLSRAVSFSLSLPPPSPGPREDGARRRIADAERQAARAEGASSGQGSRAGYPHPFSANGYFWVTIATSTRVATSPMSHEEDSFDKVPKFLGGLFHFAQTFKG